MNYMIFKGTSFTGIFNEIFYIGILKGTWSIYILKALLLHMTVNLMTSEYL